MPDAPDHVTTDTGRVIYIDPGDERGRQLVASGGDLNPGSMRLWRQALGMHAWNTVLDIGANYGEMLVGPDLPSGARLIAFEPNPHVLPYLERTLAAAGLTVDLQRVAVSNAPGTLSFDLDTTWSGTSSIHAEAGEASSASSSVVAGHTFETIEVPATTLDDAVHARKLGAACIKVDVEGFESQVLEGATKTLATTRFWALMLEIHYMPADQLVALASEHALILMDRRTDMLTHVPGTLPLLREALDSDAFYPQDALLVSRALLGELGADRVGTGDPATVSRLVQTAAQRERDLAVAWQTNADLQRTISWRVTRPLRAIRGIGRG